MISAPAGDGQPSGCDIVHGFAALQFCCDGRKDGFRNDRRDAVSDHSKAVPDGRVEEMIIRKSLEPRGLPDSDYSVLFGMKRSDSLIRSPIGPGSGSQSGALSGPSQPRVAADLIGASRWNRGKAFCHIGSVLDDAMSGEGPRF